MRPLRRSRARFPLLSPTVTSSPGAGEVFPQRESQAVKRIAKVLGAKRKLPVVLLPLPLGEVASRSDDGEGEPAKVKKRYVKEGCCTGFCATASYYFALYYIL